MGTPGRPHKCACGQAFTKLHDLKDHVKVVHGGNYYICDHCGTTFKQKKSMVRHLKEKHQASEGTLYKCKATKCHFGADDEEVVKKHMAKRHGIGYKQKCKTCDKEISLLGTAKHDKVCKGRVDPETRKLKCSYSKCDKVFITAFGKKRHEDIVHRKTGGYTCDICGRVLSTKGSLERHMLRHEDQDDPDKDASSSEADEGED